MDLKITGKFIQERRKAQGLTQAELAEKISVSEKTVSKWECGKGFPDTSLMLPLCEALAISANELLSGKLLGEKEYKTSAEEHLILLKNQQQKLYKHLFVIEWVLLGIAVLVLIGGGALIEYLPMPIGWQWTIMGVGLLILIVAIFFATRIERNVGFFECAHCKHKYIPSYGKMILAMHVGTTRYMKCPKCGKHSWSKKKLKDE
ncbi:MAG: helix-turn-helix transcriptional regulator [Clostridia bacterium]|nr:helix-turn-helix transcriptional regulator [Clostridia bacterium]